MEFSKEKTGTENGFPKEKTGTENGFPKGKERELPRKKEKGFPGAKKFKRKAKVLEEPSEICYVSRNATFVISVLHSCFFILLNFVFYFHLRFIRNTFPIDFVLFLKQKSPAGEAGRAHRRNSTVKFKFMEEKNEYDTADPKYQRITAF